jgi:hypothetical protein
MEPALLCVAFMLVASHGFVLESFQSVFRHRLECFRTYLDFSFFSRVQSSYATFQRYFQVFQIIYLGSTCPNISLLFFSDFLKT